MEPKKMEPEKMETRMSNQELLSAYLDGELAPGQVREVEERLTVDSEFLGEYLRLQQVSVAFVAFEIRCEPDPGFLVRHRERREDLSPVLRWTWRQLGFRLAAAAAALLVAAGLSLWQAGRPQADVAETMPAVEELDLLAFEGEILAASNLESLGIPAEIPAEIPAKTDPAEEPVLLIALGGSFSPPGER